MKHFRDANDEVSVVGRYLPNIDPNFDAVLIVSWPPAVGGQGTYYMLLVIAGWPSVWVILVCGGEREIPTAE